MVPISTSVAQAGSGPTALSLPAGAGGLPKPSVALCHQATTLDRNKLQQNVGRLAEGELLRVGAGLRAALALEDERPAGA